MNHHTQNRKVQKLLRIISRLIFHHSRCVKRVQIQIFFWSVFCGTRTEYGPEKTLYFDTFHVVSEFSNFEDFPIKLLYLRSEVFV